MCRQVFKFDTGMSGWGEKGCFGKARVTGVWTPHGGDPAAV